MQDTNPKSFYRTPSWAIEHIPGEQLDSIVNNLLSLGAESNLSTAEVHAHVDRVLATLVPEDKRKARRQCTNRRCNGGWIYHNGSEYPCSACHGH